MPEPDENVIVVTGRGLEETPATPAYDVQTINREELVTTASGRLEDALANVAGRVVSILLWLVITPYALGRLGPERFGVWALFFVLSGRGSG